MSTFRFSFSALAALSFFSSGLTTNAAHAVQTPSVQLVAPARLNPHDAAAQRRSRERISSPLHRNAQASATPAVTPGSSGIIETLAGSVPFQQPITALKAGLGYITGIAADSQGNLFVASNDFRCVLKVDSAGNVTVYAGQPLPSGPAQASGDGGPATAATLVDPYGLAVDSAGNLFIADPGSITVRKVDASTGVITTVAGMTGQVGTSPDGTPATSAMLELPTAVAVDPEGNLFIANIFVINRVDHGTGQLTVVAGSYNGPGAGTCPQLTATQTCPATTVGFFPSLWPNSIAIGNGVLYIAAESVQPNFYGNSDSPSILAVQISTGTMRLAAGGLTQGNPPTNTPVGANIYPLGLTVDGAGNVDFTNGTSEDYYGAEQIMQLSADGTKLSTIAGTGVIGSSGDGGQATVATIDEAVAIVAAPSGNILFAEPSRVRSIDPTGKIATTAGDGTDNYFGDGGPAQAAGLGSPSDNVIDAQGNIYIADAGNQVVRRIDATTGIITTVAGNGGFADYQQSGGPATSLPGDGGPATATPLGDPEGLALDSGGNLYIGDYYQGVRVVNLNTGIISTLNNQLSVLGTIAFDGKHTLYAGNFDSSVVAVDATSGATTRIAGNGYSGSETLGGSFGDGGPAAAAIIWPAGMALDSKGNLYIADSLENAVRVIDLSTGIINLYAGVYPATNPDDGSNIGYSGDGGPADAAFFGGDIPGLHYDGAGHLLVADANNNAIREIDLTTTIINTVAGNGTPGYAGDGASATAATLNRPFAASADASGNLFISDLDNDRLRRVVIKPTALTATLAASSLSLTFGTSVTLTATYTGPTYGIAPTGTVTFFDGSTSLSSGVLSTAGTSGGFVATLTSDTLSAGVHNITAQLAADVNYAAVATPAVTLTVAAPVPAVTLSTTSLTFAAETVGATSAPQNVTLTNTGTAALAITSIVASGDFAQTNTCGTSLAAGAACTIPVSFTPTAGGTRNGTLAITDNAGDSPETVSLSGGGETVSITSSSPTLTVGSMGGSSTTNLNLLAVDGFTGTVNLTCAVTYLGQGTANNPPSCSLNPAQLQVAGTSVASTTLTVATTVASASIDLKRKMRESGLALAAVFIVGLLPRRRWRGGVLLGALCLAILGGVLGCGSGGGTAPTRVAAGATTGSYQVMVTATSGTTVASVTLPVTVQ
jgi:hypothetical protein